MQMGIVCIDRDILEMLYKYYAITESLRFMASSQCHLEVLSF